jgi:2-(3-amino-3-carboxypropyl)histidine synthase
MKVLYIGDGRFHLESMMLANPHLQDQFYQYDPYAKKLSREGYDYKQTFKYRHTAVSSVRRDLDLKKQEGGVMTVGVIWGTLGRQGNPRVVETVKQAASSQKCNVRTMVVLLSEVTPQKLALFQPPPHVGKDLMSVHETDLKVVPVNVDAWVQTSCPRLSIDWGHGFNQPLLTPYEAVLAFGQVEPERVAGWYRQAQAEGQVGSNGSTECCSALTETCCKMPNHQDYPMDFYAADSLGPWTPSHLPRQPADPSDTKKKLGMSWRDRLAARRAQQPPAAGSE